MNNQFNYIIIKNIGPAAAGPAGPVPTPMYIYILGCNAVNQCYDSTPLLCLNTPLLMGYVANTLPYFAYTHRCKQNTLVCYQNTPWAVTPLSCNTPWVFFFNSACLRGRRARQKNPAEEPQNEMRIYHMFARTRCGIIFIGVSKYHLH